jgi:hypothetical protein
VTSVAIIGAGPYGLSAAAHLRGAGVDVHVLGRPMEFWRTGMPAGMLLRSSPRSSHLSDPGRRFTLHAFAAAAGEPVVAPIPLDRFLAYGAWFAERTRADADPRRVLRVERDGARFALHLDDGEELAATRVVVAAGLAPFGRRPPVFEALGPERVSHSGDHADLARFAGARVLVIGAGQSALECAALAREAGADVEVLARAGGVNWLADLDHGRRVRDRGYPPTDVGGRVRGWLAASPDVFRRLPEQPRPWIRAGCLRPAGSHWLRARLAGVPIRTGAAVAAAREDGDGVELALAGGRTVRGDHVLLGTGYAVDVARYPFLAPELVAAIVRREGLPVLRAGLESSVDGLHFLGAPAVLSFGPVMRFVTGAWYAAPALADRVAGRRRAVPRRAYA